MQMLDEVIGNTPENSPGESGTAMRRHDDIGDSIATDRADQMLRHRTKKHLRLDLRATPYLRRARLRVMSCIRVKHAAGR